MQFHRFLAFAISLNDVFTQPLVNLMIFFLPTFFFLFFFSTLGINFHRQKKTFLDDGTEDDEEEHAEGRESKDN